MKIVVITSYWKNSPGGGIIPYLSNLTDEFRRRNVDVEVVFNIGSDLQNYHVVGNKILFTLKSYLILNKIRPDVIFSHGSWYCLLPGYLYKVRHSVRLIHTFHSEATKKLPFYGRIFFQHILNKCDYVTFVSKKLEMTTRNILMLNFKNTKTTYAGVTLPNKISEKEIREFQNKFNIKEDSVILLANGLTAVDFKAEGAKILIQAISKLKIKYPNIILILTREGKFSKELKEFAKETGVSENVIFTGTIDNPNIPLHICDIYTHTPLGEGLPLAILEAMAMGKPIIATSVGGIPEAIENGINGIIVPPNLYQVVQKIDYLLMNKDIAQKLGKNAQKTVQERFNPKTSADDFLILCQ